MRGLEVQVGARKVPIIQIKHHFNVEAAISRQSSRDEVCILPPRWLGNKDSFISVLTCCSLTYKGRTPLHNQTHDVPLPRVHPICSLSSLLYYTVVTTGLKNCFQRPTSLKKTTSPLSLNTTSFRVCTQILGELWFISRL